MLVLNKNFIFRNGFCALAKVGYKGICPEGMLVLAVPDLAVLSAQLPDFCVIPKSLSLLCQILETLNASIIILGCNIVMADGGICMQSRKSQNEDESLSILGICLNNFGRSHHFGFIIFNQLDNTGLSPLWMSISTLAGSAALTVLPVLVGFA